MEDVRIYHVLIVDDSPEDRQAFVRFLTRDTNHIYQCHEATNAQEALKLCQKQRFDCMLIDQILPDMLGIELLKYFSDRHGPLYSAMVIITGAGNESLAVASMKYGAQDYVVKSSVTPLELRRVVQNAIEKVRLNRQIAFHQDQISGIIESITDAFFAVDSDGRFIFLNQAAQKLLNRSSHELISKNLWHEYAESIRQLTADHDITPLKHNQPVQFEHFFPDTDDWFEIRLYPINRGFSVYLQNITERKKAELIVRSSEERLTRIFESSFEGLTIISADGYLQSINAAAERILGLDRAKIIKQHYMSAPWTNHFEGLNGEAFTEDPIQKVLSTGQALYNVKVFVTLPSQEIILVVLNAVPLRNAHNQIEEVAVSFHDITEQTKSEETIRHQAREMQMLIENIPDIIARFDRDLRHLFVNPEVERVTNLVVSDFIGKTNRELGMPADLCDLWDSAILNVFETRQPISIEFSTNFMDKPEIFQSRLVPELDANDQVTSVLSITRKITERKEAEATLEFLVQSSDQLSKSLDLEQTYQTLANLVIPKMADVIAIEGINPDSTLYTQYFDVNSAYTPTEREYFERIFNSYSTSQLRRKVIELNRCFIFDGFDQNTIELPVVGDTMKQFTRIESIIIAPLMARNTIFGVLTIIRHKDRPAFTERDQIMIEGLASRAAITLDNAQLYQTAQEALRERNAFLSVASHEIRNPLTSLLGRVELMLRRAEKTGLDERTISDIQIVGDQGKRINTLLTDLLDVSRLDASNWQLELTDLDLVALLQRLVNETVLLSPIHTLQFECTIAHVMVLGDTMRLEQVFRNLLNNAIKYSPGGGLITISLQCGRALALIKIRDEGLGIDPSVQQHIFDRFYRIENEQTRHISGSGIGLYVVRTIIKAHGGSIAVQSAIGEGSTFSIRLPITHVKYN